MLKVAVPVMLGEFKLSQLSREKAPAGAGAPAGDQVD